ncbi:hypothetical protein FJ434_23025 [Mesorhizobium sp. B2-5-13]|uniref:hypothetical protein n=1 Tax=unclassified Mesorhizobium TaxID=325217 RepID=UPI0011262611|nr:MULTISPECIES: hypothetical protein [unclassified Mesorhizobium]TPJ38840.1 hypothetical protein FJ432_21050 [Mesorhizobium sp. B2-6-5]TPJ79481.1 hypothetical protein FJ434_23025 [Mesorhizobium sp. B2-5-13]TPK46300.1 hypothetical protein FJ560_19490 [Mesorhizobium sp. B2-5-5]
MTTKRLAICILAVAMGFGMSSAFAGAKHRHYQQGEQERYVPADDDLIDFLFGGPRYYDQQLFTTAAGACSYHRTGPDGFAINKINDHHCGK